MSKSASISYHTFELPNSEGGHQMDEPQYTLLETLSAVLDPRKARGKHYSWVLLLTVVSSALASGERHGHEIATWVGEHATALIVWLHPERGWHSTTSMPWKGSIQS